MKETSKEEEKELVSEILKLPLSEAYYKVLGKYRFNYMNMKNSSGVYNHCYQSELHKGLNPPVTKLVRLA